MPKRLPLRCEAYPDESLNGFVQRLAKRNQLRWRDLIPGEDAPYPIMAADQELVASLAAMADRDVDTLAAMDGCALAATTSTDGQGEGGGMDRLSWLSHSRGRYRAICPACVAERRYHRIWWELTIVRACAEHRCGLVTECPKCGVELEWRRSTLGACSCEKDFATLPVTLWPEARLHGTDYIASRLNGDDPANAPVVLRGVPFPQALELIKFFGGLASAVAPWTVGDRRDEAFADHLNAGLHALERRGKTLVRCVDRLEAHLAKQQTQRPMVAAWCSWMLETCPPSVWKILGMVRDRILPNP